MVPLNIASRYQLLRWIVAFHVMRSNQDTLNAIYTVCVCTYTYICYIKYSIYIYIYSKVQKLKTLLNIDSWASCHLSEHAL